MADTTDDFVINLKKNDYGYDRLLVRKSKVLGTGAFGKVVKATLNNEPCAAKLLHTEFFQHDDPGMKAFEASFIGECILMRKLKNPHIVQFLGMAMDPKDRRPILLMELMEESLTHYLETVEVPLPYHTQVNITHDTALALDYLHRNRIIHRDLSSNNILLKGNQAKVTDFGMSKIVDGSRRMTEARKTEARKTVCPGTAAYMPPEALQGITPYSGKLDTFSLGVLMIQIVTRTFPAPTNHGKLKDDPLSATGYVFAPVPEVERRKSDISKVPRGHALVPIFHHCIKDKEGERPTAAHLCQIMEQLKSSKAYTTSVSEAKERKRSVEQQLCQKDEEKKQEVAKLKIEVNKQKQSVNYLRRELNETKQEAKHARLLQEEIAAEKEEEKRKLAREKDQIQREAVARQRKLEREVVALRYQLLPPRRTDTTAQDEKALFEAAKKGDVAAVTRLITDGVNVDCTPYTNNRTPLMIASLSGHGEIVKLLIKAKAQVNRQEKDGWTALHMAAQEGKVDVVRVLIESRADVNLQPESGQTALYMASLNGHLPVVQLLLRRRADITICKKNGASPLYAACQEGHNDVVNALIRSGADTNRALKEGATPLYMASHNGHSDVVKMLIRNGANPSKPFKGWKPIDIARAKQHSEIVHLLNSIV